MTGRPTQAKRKDYWCPYNTGNPFRLLSDLNIKIPHSFSVNTSGDVRFRRHLSVFFKLKSFYSSGSIHNIRSNKASVAVRCGISEGKLRQALSFLYQEGLCWNDEGGGLRFASRNKISLLYNGYATKKRHLIKSEVPSVKEIELFIFSCSIKENLCRQKKELREKVTENQLKCYGKINSGKIENSIRKRIRNKVSATFDHQVRVSRDGFNGNNKKINDQVTLSRGGLSRLWGGRSISLGTQIAKKLSAANYITDVKNIAFVAIGTLEMFKAMDLPRCFFFQEGKILRRLPNTITVNPL